MNDERLILSLSLFLPLARSALRFQKGNHNKRLYRQFLIKVSLENCTIFMHFIFICLVMCRLLVFKRMIGIPTNVYAREHTGSQGHN